MKSSLLFAAALTGAITSALPAQTTSQLPWSVRFARAVVARNPQVHARWDYTAGVVLLAIDRVAQRRNDPALSAYVKQNMNKFIQPDGSITGYKPEEFNLDHIAQGRLLFPLATRSEERRVGKECRSRGPPSRYIQII